MVVIRLFFPCYLSSGIQRWQRWQRSQRRPGNFLFQMAVHVHLRSNVLLTGKTRRGIEERSLEASSREGKSGEGKQWSHLMWGWWGSSMSVCPQPSAQGGWWVGGGFPWRSPCPSWAVQSRTTAASQNAFSWWYDNTRRGRGGEFRDLGILSTMKRKVNCFRCKWRNAIPRGRVWELSR